MLKKISLLLIILSFVFIGVYADSNGVWHYAKDVRPGIFGSDENSGNFSFMSKVGINETKPVSMLQVGPQIGVDKPLVTINAENYDGSALRIKGSLDNPNVAPLVVFKGSSTGGDPAFKVDGNGNVGIGVTTPEASLHLEDTLLIGDYIGDMKPLLSINTMHTSNPGAMGIGRTPIRILQEQGSRTGSAAFVIHSPNTLDHPHGDFMVNAYGDIKTLGNIGIGSGGRIYEIVSKLQVGPQIASDRPLVTFNAENYDGSSVRIKGSTIKPNAAPLVVFRGNSIGDDPAFKVDGNGNVGIGEKAPSEKLHVNGNLKVTGAKHFVQSFNTTHDVVYTSSESGEAMVEWTDNILVNKKGVFVEFPEHFKSVYSSKKNYYVIVSPINSLANVGVFNKGIEGFLIKADKKTFVDFHVRAIRKGFEDKDIIRKNKNIN